MASNSMDFKTFMNVAKVLPADISVLLRGDHGIGKSQGVRQVADHFGLVLTDKRLSQMSEGDLVGLPKLDGGVTRFMPPDWLKDACDNPRVLFLDEINRATPEVMQAAFQLVLDRELNGHRLHEGTRVFAAINTAQSYQVNEMDPALLDRFYTIDLHPTIEEWLDHAKPTIHPNLWAFLKSNSKFVDPSPKAEPASVEPSRRSWFRLDAAHKAAGVADDCEVEGYYNLARGFVGIEAAVSLVGFVKSMDKQVSAKDILDNFDKNRKKIEGLGQEKWNICIDKIKDHVAKESLKPEQGANLAAFAKVLPDELIVPLWSVLSACGTENLEQVKIAHKALGQHIVRIYRENPEKLTAAADAAKKKEEEEANKATEENMPSPKGKGKAKAK